jgi:hypothetical protein
VSTRTEYRAVAHFHPFKYHGAAGVEHVRNHTHPCLPVTTRAEAERDALGFATLEQRGVIRPVSHVVIETRVISDWTPASSEEREP